MSVVQAVRKAAPDKDPWVAGLPFHVPLPKKCHDGLVQYSRGTWRTRNMPDIEGQVQFQWVINCQLKVKKDFRVRHEVVGVVQFARLGADAAL